MTYLGNNPITQSFASGTDYFSGTGTQTAFTLSRTVNTVNDIEVFVAQLMISPQAYTLSGAILTFTIAPAAGTNNIVVRYLSNALQTVAPGQGTVGIRQLSATGTPNNTNFLRGDNTWSASGGLNYIYQLQLPWQTPNPGGGTVVNSTADPTSGRIASSVWSNCPIPYASSGTAATQIISAAVFNGTVNPSYNPTGLIYGTTPFVTQFAGTLNVNSNSATPFLWCRVQMQTVHFPGTAQQIITNRYYATVAPRNGDFVSIGLTNFSSWAVLNVTSATGSIPLQINFLMSFFISSSDAQNPNATPVAIADNTNCTLTFLSPAVTFMQWRIT